MWVASFLPENAFARARVYMELEAPGVLLCLCVVELFLSVVLYYSGNNHLSYWDLRKG